MIPIARCKAATNGSLLEILTIRARYRKCLDGKDIRRLLSGLPQTFRRCVGEGCC